ncbi:MAG: nucleotidyltransferase [Clostridia bacterium]|nr:nucleotidyltransferase [Clostridia bacterium]
MNKPTLLVLAAGMGSRYGGLKQIDPLGPNGEIIIDYSVHDAILAGFGKVVFVIKKELEETFREVIGSRFEGKIEVAYAYQQMDDLPGGFTAPEGRVKPWGTGHAVYAARNHISGPFGVINADDFLGRDSFCRMGGFCVEQCDGAHMAMVGFRLANTLSESGSVSRGVCEAENGFLTSVTERLDIRRDYSGVISCTGGDRRLVLQDKTPVSMNVWAMHSDVFSIMEEDFTAWLKNGAGDPLKREYYLPAFMDSLVKTGKASVAMLDTTSKWFGVTHRADKEQVQAALNKLHEDGTYPALR